MTAGRGLCAGRLAEPTALARASGPRSGLVRVVERDPDDRRRDAPAIALGALDLEAGTKPAMCGAHAGEGEIPLEDR